MGHKYIGHNYIKSLEQRLEGNPQLLVRVARRGSGDEQSTVRRHRDQFDRCVDVLKRHSHSHTDMDPI